MSDESESKDMEFVHANIRDNVDYLNRTLGVDKSFDMMYRKLEYAGREFALYFVDGFVKDDIVLYIQTHLANLRKGELSVNAVKKLFETHITYLEVSTTDKMEDIVTQVLSGPAVLLIDGEKEALVIDARTYPARQPEEPDLERVVRGPRDGFTETIIFNTALTRRRVRDPSLRMHYMRVGKRSKTDLCLSYLEGVADPGLVDTIKSRLENIDIQGLSMAEKTIEEVIFRKNWNPYPLVRYTERPDVAAVHLFEGHVLIYTDTSPSVMITPTTLFHHVQHAEEYRQKPVVGAYLRWIRLLAMLLSIFLPALYLTVATNQHLLPEGLEFIGPKKEGNIPLFWQFLFAELGIDILRMAAVHTPTSLATALGLVAAILIGQIAVEAGLFSNEVILYLAAAVMGTYATPSYELSLANRLTRIFLLVLVFLIDWPGLLIGAGIWLIVLAATRSLTTPYLWPLIPFNPKAFLEVLIRTPIRQKDKRTHIVTPQDSKRK